MKNLILILFSILLIGSCVTDLDRFPEANLSDAVFWKDEQNFKEGCNRLYLFVDGQAMIVTDDQRSDYQVTMTGPNPVSNGTRNTPTTSSDWDKPYQLIFTANKILEKAEDSDLPTIDQWKGEAMFWRAYAYFDLLKKYGGVPLVLKTLDIDDEDLYGGRAERAEVIQQIYNDLDFAAANLPTFTSLGEANYGRVSRSAALALKARAALYEGTRQKFHSFGTPAAHLQLAVSAAQTIMQEKEHRLYTAKPYMNLFQYDGEGFANKENILPIIYGEDNFNDIKSHRIKNERTNGRDNITRAMVENYLCTDGLPWDMSPLAVTPQQEPSPWYWFRNKDPRMQASLFVVGEVYRTFTDYFPWERGNNFTKYQPRKYFVPGVYSQGESAWLDVAMLRYGEVLLNYAEAKFELNGSISDEDLNISINLLRDRVGMPHLTNAFVTTHGLDMRNEIRRERNVELAQEGFRYDDIMRWKIAEDVLPKPILGAYFFANVYKSTVLPRNAEGYIICESGEKRYFDPEKDYFYPIPTREIGLSGGKIVQNPKWE